MKTLINHSLGLVIVLFCSVGLAVENSDEAVKEMQKGWAEANYRLQGKEQIRAFDELLERTESFGHQFTDDAKVLIWSGIIKSTYAGVKGGLSALKYAKKSRADLERALELDPKALDGSAYTSLGTLYYKVPGWPLGFGDDKIAEYLLRKALEINPVGIDPNYFYGDYLIEKGRYGEARTYLEKALHAPPRPDRPLADEGRRRDIETAMAEVNKHLK